MAGRPCNPNSDLKRLWQTLLPDTPFPQCGVPADSAEEIQSAEAASADAAEPTARVTGDLPDAVSTLPERQR
jgi:hypothetical protein